MNGAERPAAAEDIARRTVILPDYQSVASTSTSSAKSGTSCRRIDL
jgi:hypothetical protein